MSGKHSDHTQQPAEPTAGQEPAATEQAQENQTAPPGEQAQAEETGNGAPLETETPAPETPTPEEEAPSELEQARQEAADLNDKLLRLHAEFDNFRKRIAKEHAESLRYGLTPLVREVAGVMDNLERALLHGRNGQEASADALVSGVEMVMRQMQEALGRFGVTRIEAEGNTFDPNLHEAMSVVESDQVPENQVLQEFQAGYLLHDRVVRPARVSVSKRPEGAAQESNEASDPESEQA